MMKDKPCVLVDIDGTIADLGHRLHHVTSKPKNWEAFFEALGEDTPINPVIELTCAVTQYWPFGAILVSGRPDNYRTQTVEWLSRYGVWYEALYMRKAGDYRSDVIVKREILDQLRQDGFVPELVIDDRPAVVDMWRAQGLICLQAAYHEHVPSRGFGRSLLTILVGPCGAGKSTLAKKRWPARWVISSDDVREDMLGDRLDQSQNAQVFEAVHALAQGRLRLGLPAVIDATNIRRKDRMACAALTPPGVMAAYVVVDRPMEEKIETREWRPEELLKKHDQTFRSQIKEILAGDGLPHVRVEDLRGSL